MTPGMAGRHQFERDPPSRDVPHHQERAEYGAHLLSDFLFLHVVSQILIIRFHDIRSWY